jgi:hypothetical protein
MFRKFVSGLCRDRRGLVLVAGAVGVLTGVEHLFSARSTKSGTAKPTPALPKPAQQTRIKISRTKSELGYVYWVVRDTCGDPSYTLFDTWQDAMDEAARRLMLVTA